MSLTNDVTGWAKYLRMLNLSLILQLAPDDFTLSQCAETLDLADTLFRALRLALALVPVRAGAAAPPPWRGAAFAKRLLTAALHWPPANAARAVTLVGELLARDAKLEALLFNGNGDGGGGGGGTGGAVGTVEIRDEKHAVSFRQEGEHTPIRVVPPNE